MSLHNARPCRRFSRGASLAEYALLLFMVMGGTAAAMRGTGHNVQESFAAAADILGGGSGGNGANGGVASGTGSTTVGVPDDGDGGAP